MLENIAKNNDANMVAVLEKGGVEHTLEVIDKHTSSPVASRGCSFLLGLSWRNKQTLVKMGVSSVKTVVSSTTKGAEDSCTFNMLTELVIHLDGSPESSMTHPSFEITTIAKHEGVKAMVAMMNDLVDRARCDRSS